MTMGDGASPEVRYNTFQTANDRGRLTMSDKIVLSESAYKFDCRAAQNPPESRYLTRDGAPVVWGFLWEEPRELGEIVVEIGKEFPAFRTWCLLEYWAPATNWCASRQFTWGQGSWQAYPAYARNEDDKVFRFPAMKVRTVMLRYRVLPPNALKNMPEQAPTVYGVTVIEKLRIKVATGLWGHPHARAMSVHNGRVDLAGTMEGGEPREFELDVARPVPDEGTITAPDRTVATLEIGDRQVSFLPTDAEKHPYLCIPDFGVMVWTPEKEKGLPKGWRDAAPRKGKRILERVAELPPQSFARVLEEVRMEPVKTIRLIENTVPKPTNSELSIPDPQWQMQWDVGATHLVHFCKPQADGRWEIRNGPYGMLAMESLYIERILDRCKYHEIVRGGCDVYLDSYSVRTPEGLFQTVEGCMCMPYGVKEGDSWLGMDPGCVMMALAEHYFITRDREWLRARADKLLGCCGWILREIDLHRAEGAWDEGLIPPTTGGDISEWFSYYYWNAIFYEGMVKAIRALGDIGGPEADAASALEPRVRRFREDLRKAWRKSVGLAPVEPLRDGTFAPGMPPIPYLRGFASDVYPVSPVCGLRNAWMDIDLNGVKLIDAGVFDADEPEARWMADVLEDRLMPDSWLLPKKWDAIRSDPVTASRDATAQATDYDPERDWFSWGGTGWQNGYFPMPEFHLLAGRRNAWIRCLYNTYGIEADKDSGWFREHAASLHYPPKSFEEAQFLNRLLAGIVYERGDDLILDGGAPDAWYGTGFGVMGMPTYFGLLDHEVTREGDVVRAVTKLVRHAKTGRIRLTLRHPDGRPIRSATVDGAPADHDAANSWIWLDPSKDAWTTEARF
jgi:hypothetical protein